MAKEVPPLYYSDYLALDKILNSQSLRSAEYGKPAHDEMLFIIVHQAYELWFKQILHEIESIWKIFSENYIEEKQIAVAVSRLNRIHKIQKLLIEQLEVLETMTPMDFLEFRDYLMPASGFQSFQFRLLENTIGLAPEQRLAYEKASYQSRLSEEHKALVSEAEQKKSLFDLVQSWLERTPFLEMENFQFFKTYHSAVENMLEEDKKTISKNPHFSEDQRKVQQEELEKTRENYMAVIDKEKHNSLMERGARRLSHRATQAVLFIHLYRDEPMFQLPFHFLTGLLNMDELWTNWRYRHALMVHRMIGTKIGTGGSSGYSYLKATVEKHRIFADLFQISTFLIPRSALPALPEEIKKKLNFYYSNIKP
jgi:tryptophan 2,3-dioxygenase